MYCKYDNRYFVLAFIKKRLKKIETNRMIKLLPDRLIPFIHYIDLSPSSSFPHLPKVNFMIRGTLNG
jgi:hypothetical protein